MEHMVWKAGFLHFPGPGSALLCSPLVRGSGYSLALLYHLHAQFLLSHKRQGADSLWGFPLSTWVSFPGLLYAVFPPFSTLQVRPPLTASHVVGVLEARSQYIDQALLTRMILLPQFSPVLKSQVLSAMPPWGPWHLPNRTLVHSIPGFLLLSLFLRRVLPLDLQSQLTVPPHPL